MVQDKLLSGIEYSGVVNTVDSTELLSWLEEDFAKDASLLLPYFMDDEGQTPLLSEHVPLAVLEAGLLLDAKQYKTLSRGYTYLAAYYFTVDSLVDGHERLEGRSDLHSLAAPYIGAMVSKGLGFLTDFLSDFKCEESDWVALSSSSLFLENARALREEMDYFVNPLGTRTSREDEIIVERANLMLFLFELVWKAAKRDDYPKIKDLVARYLVLLQDGDDLSDWREDHKVRNFTPFLRTCFSRERRVLTTEELERLIYIDGMFELWLAKTIAGFSTLKNDFQESGFVSFAAHCEGAAQRGKEALKEMIYDKRRFS